MALAICCSCQSALAQAKSTFHTIDILEFTRKPLSAYRPDESWSAPPRGLHTWAGVPFQMGGKLDITGMGSARDSRFYPTRMIGIPVGKKGQVLHVLHGAAYDDNDGTPVARMVLNYANGQRRSFLLVYGVHTRKWDLDRKTLEDTNSVIAWTGRNAGVDLRLCKTAFANPLPALEVKSIDLISLFSRANPMIVAMTMEELARADAARGDARPPGGVQAATSEDDSAYRAELLLRVLDAISENGVAGAELTLEVTEEDRGFGFGTYKADSNGHILLAYPPKRISALHFEVTAPNHIGKRADLEKPAGGAFPVEHTIKLERGGIQIGGLVRAASGQTITGATVMIYGVVRDEAGQFLMARHGSAQTDQRGEWTSSSVPKDFTDLQFHLAHPEYRPADYASADSPVSGSVLKQDLLAGKAVMVMQGGINIEGKVLDAAGKAIPNAEVLLIQRLDAERATNRTARTDPAGAFKFVLMQAADLHLIVQAAGYAPVFRQLTPSDDVKPIEFRLAKGKILRGRVLDNEGKPISGASLRVDSWADGPPLHWESQSDADGRFAWDSAPEAAVNLSVQAKGYIPISQRETRASDEELSLRLEKTFLVSGKVLDAETKQPIQQFSIIHGRNHGRGPDVYWERHAAMPGTGGAYSVENSESHGGRLQVLVEAPEYLPSVSPPFTRAGWQTHDFLLKKGDGPKGKVRLADGSPVRGAEVALVGTGTYRSLGKARLQNVDNIDNTITDAQGRFSFPAMYATAVIAIHDQGYAEAAPEELAASGELLLQSWGTLKGTLILGGKPGTNESVMLAPNRYGSRLNYSWDNFKRDTDNEGRFEFSHVPPGQRFLVRLIPSDGQSWIWSNITPVEVKPGEVTTVTYGGAGRTVIGKVKPSDPKRQIIWQSGHHSLATPMPKPPKEFRTREEAELWNYSPEMEAARKNHKYYAVRFFEDGSFRIDEVPPGAYNLNLNFYEEGKGSFGSINREVEVSPGNVEEPFDLGTLELVVSQ